MLLSGGRDSTCLLDLAVRIAGASAVSALHVNYALRDAAAGDERHCAALCDRLGVPLETTHPGTPRLGNLQAWARDARYGAAAQIAVARRAEVAAGHTATDQVETILYRLASSPSRRALLGMRSREGSLVRPLLAFTREETTTYCAERGLGWREDESNDTDQYARGRIRHGLVPALREIHPGAETNVLALAELLRDEADVLEAVVDEALGGRGRIELAALAGLPTAVARLVVQRLADAAAGRPAPGAARRLLEILGMGPDAALDLPGGVRVRTEAGVVAFSRTPSRPHTGRSGAVGGPPAQIHKIE